MARVLRLFENFTPNQANNTYYLFNDLMSFKTGVLDTQTHVDIPLDNYRINTNVIKIKKSNDISYASIKNVTYVVEMETGTPAYTTIIYKCYHVKRYEELDYFVLYVEVDLWGTYIKYASLSNINILRCNRNIGDGIYDEIKHTLPAEVGTAMNVEYKGSYTGSGWLTDDKRYAYEDYISIVFAVEYNVQQQVFGDDHISETGLFAIDFTTLRGLVDASHKDSAGVNIASDIIGGIYGVGASWGDVLDARVINAWILPNALFYKSSFGHNFTSKSAYAGNSSVAFTAVQVLPRRNIQDFISLPNNPNYAVYFGTWNNGLKLNHYTSNNLRVKVITNVSQTSVQVLVQQGENQKDITNAFEITLTTNAGVTTGIRHLAKSLSRAISIGGSMAKDFAKGDYAGGGLSAVKGVVDMIPLKPTIDGAIGGGDGGTTFYSTHKTTLQNVDTYYTNNPFCACYFISTIDEEAQARLYGATFNKTWADLSTLDNSTLLGTGDLTDTYIMANLRVSGIPKDAKDYIENVFKNGIYMQYIH